MKKLFLKVKGLILGFIGTSIICPYCSSLYVTFYSGASKENNNERIEMYNVECFNCGAKGKVEETWGKNNE